jgi:hypothetical protein
MSQAGASGSIGSAGILAGCPEGVLALGSVGMGPAESGWDGGATMVSQLRTDD